MTEWTLADAYELLAVAQSFDRRTVGDFDAESWRRAMHGLRLDDAKAAIVEHFTTSTDWLMPAHVRAGVTRIRKDRIERRAIDWVPDADPDDPIAYQRALREANARAADGTEQPRDLQQLPGTFRDVPHASLAAIEAARAALPPRRPRDPQPQPAAAAEALTWPCCEHCTGTDDAVGHPPHRLPCGRCAEPSPVDAATPEDVTA